MAFDLLKETSDIPLVVSVLKMQPIVHSCYKNGVKTSRCKLVARFAMVTIFFLCILYDSNASMSA